MEPRYSKNTIIMRLKPKEELVKEPARVVKLRASTYKIMRHHCPKWCTYTDFIAKIFTDRYGTAIPEKEEIK